MIQENRSFDNFFGTFPGADGATSGQAEAVPKSYDCPPPFPLTKATTVPLTEVGLDGNFPNPDPYPTDSDINHMYGGFQIDRDDQKMDGFDAEGLGATGRDGPSCTYPYQYVNPKDIAPYWDLARQYVLGDRMFQQQGSGSFTAHQELIAGGTNLSSTEALINTPSYFPWGCDGNKAKLRTAIIKRGGGVFPIGGPFPCFTYTTIRDLLDAKGVSWKFYAVRVFNYKHCPQCEGSGIWSAFDAIRAVRYSREWDDNVSRSPLDVFTDITKRRLPAVSWITPDGANSDHLGTHSTTGPSWVASIVNAIGESPYWNSTAIVILWDDWGGLYDHVPPPMPRNWQGGPGFRVPLLIVSPYVKPHVEHTLYEFGSILKFIENNWSLGSLGRNDAASRSIGNAFDFEMKPRPFKRIGAKYPLSFFLHQNASGEPPDTE